MNEANSKMTEQEIVFLSGKKGNVAVMLVLLMLGAVFNCVISYISYKKMPEDAFWFYFIPFIGLTGLFVYFIFSGFARNSQINRELKAGMKKIITVKLEDYEERVYTNRSGRYVVSGYYFKAGGKTYEVSKEKFFSFLNGDLVDISLTPVSEIVLNIEKAKTEIT